MLKAFLGFRERVGAWCAALALLGGGVFLWDPPREVVEEIPQHRPIAMGVFAFGALFVMALVLKGQAGYRVRKLMLVGLAVVVGGGLAYWMQDAGRDIVALKQEGVYVEVPVVGHSVKHNPKSKKVTRLTVVHIEGQRRTFELGRTARRGELVRVLAGPDREGAIVAGTVPQEWWPLISAKAGGWLAILFLVLVAICALSIPINLWGFLAGAPRGTDPDAGRG